MKNFSRGCKKSCFLCALVLCVFLIAGISCYNGTFNEVIFRTMNDPSDECAKVLFTSKECTIYVSWQKDNGADSFRLMRSIDNTFLNFSCIYEGRNTSYVDSDVIEKTRYVYRLDKIRGDKYFAGKHFSYGFASDCRMDEYENNDTEECATFLESDLICNLPCARFVTKGHEMFDEDWFYIKLPPRRTAEIVVNQHDLVNSNAGENTQIRIQQKGMQSDILNQMNAYSIENTSYKEKIFYFKLFPEMTKIFPGNSGNTVIGYTVSLVQIHNY